MDPVASFRPFKIPRSVETQFFTPDNSNNESFMTQDLARSGLTPDDILAYTTTLIKKEGATAAYSIPYFGLDGKPLLDKQGFPAMFRTRFQLPQFSKEQRYTQPSGEALLKCDLPATLPYILPKTLELQSDQLICCEGEKKTASVLKYLGLPAFGIGGCQMWRDPTHNSKVHPWIQKLINQRSIRTVTIIPDGDVFRYDICSAYGTFAQALRSIGVDVRILNTGGKIDDLLVAWGAEGPERFRKLETIPSEDLVQSTASLIERYSLAFKRDAKGGVTAHQHTANIMKLIEEHDAFPKIWKNEDNSKIYLGDKVAEPNLTEVEIANYFQYNLGFDKVTDRTVRTCLVALSRRNSRSPFLDYIQSQTWDGVDRLDSWMIRHWSAEDSEFIREVSAKWLVSACARMDKPGVKVDWMMIVVGPQGTGKTSMPAILFKNNNLTLYGEHNDKDLHMLLHSSLCVGFDELDSFGKRESSNLKAMITRNEDAFRPPYGASIESFPRRFTLYGCGNRYEFLQSDPSGYRRYAVVEISRLLDFSGLEAERDQLWAEAWHRYQNGEKYWEVDNASTQAEKYVVPNPVEDQIIGTLETWKVSKSNANVKDGVLYFTMTGLLAGMGMERDARNTNVTREIAAVLRKLGAEQKNGSCPTGTIRGRYYAVAI